MARPIMLSMAPALAAKIADLAAEVLADPVLAAELVNGTGQGV